MKKLRKCQEDRWDFTEEDDPSVFPMYIDNPDSNYGFCPAKATWDQEAAHLFNSLLVTAYTGQMMHDGSIADQEEWYIDLLSWFLIKYDNIKFNSRFSSIMGTFGGPKGVGKILGKLGR